MSHAPGAKKNEASALESVADEAPAEERTPSQVPYAAPAKGWEILQAKEQDQWPQVSDLAVSGTDRTFWKKLNAEEAQSLEAFCAAK